MEIVECRCEAQEEGRFLLACQVDREETALFGLCAENPRVHSPPQLLPFQTLMLGRAKAETHRYES